MAYKVVKGVYMLNLGKDKTYIGCSSNVKKRIYSHKLKLRKGEHFSEQMQEDYNELGESEFTFEIFECENYEEVEALFIKMYEGALYNINKGGAAYKGVSIPDHIREKIRTSNKGVTRSEATKERIAKAKMKKVVIDGVMYGSILDASKKLGINYGTLRSRLDSKTFPNYRRAV